MAYEEGVTFTRRTGIAETDLSAKQFYAVIIDANGMNLAAAGKNIDGILQDNPASGKAGSFAAAGVTKAAISASQVVTGGTTLLEVDTGGTLIPHGSGTVVAKALETLASVAAVQIIAVELLPSNAAFS